MIDRHGIAASLARLDRWLESMRTEDGYGGPVAHWWQSCLQFSGPMLDWRYEGIIDGYVKLFRSTGDPRWLSRAVRAGDDLCNGQLPNGTFRNSSFEVGPIEGGTPHEAAADIGLLELATVLRDLGDCRWTRYFSVAERNIREYQLGRLWNGKAFLDQAWNKTMVANKNATTMEALLLYEQLSGCDLREYIEGAGNLILSAQVTDNSSYRGATIHLGSGKHRLAIGIYTARCAAALIRLHRSYPERRYLDAAKEMGNFLLALIRPNGTIFGYYPDGREILNPTWISPSGDLLRALLDLHPHMCVPEAAIDGLARAITDQQMPSGGIPTAHGLGRKGSVKQHSGSPDFRDVLPVVGWVDKSFRALAQLVPPGSCVPVVSTSLGPTDVACTWKGKHCRYRETEVDIRLVTERGDRPLYVWNKADYYPLVYEL